MEKPSYFKIWVEAARPKTLPAGVAPVLIGTSMAVGEGKWDILSGLCALIGAIFIQVGANYANDYFDYLKGADSAERLGPRRVTQAGLVKPESVRFATLLVFLFACVPGSYIVMRGGLPFVVIGLSAIFFAVVYTAGPFPLGYIGIADLFVLVYFGPVALAGTYYLHTGKFSSDAFLAGIASGLLSTALLTVNNLRDIEQDRAAGKKTLAVRFGASFARLEYMTCVLTATALIPMYLFLMKNRFYLPVAALVSTAYGLRLVRAVLGGMSGSELNQVLAATGKLLILFSILFSVCWLL